MVEYVLGLVNLLSGFAKRAVKPIINKRQQDQDEVEAEIRIFYNELVEATEELDSLMSQATNPDFGPDDHQENVIPIIKSFKRRFEKVKPYLKPNQITAAEALLDQFQEVIEHTHCWAHAEQWHMNRPPASRTIDWEVFRTTVEDAKTALSKDFGR